MPAGRPIQLTADQWRQRIVIELNGGDLLQAHIRLLWDGYDQYARAPYLQYLWTKNAAVDLLLGHLDEQLSFPIEGDLETRMTSRRLVLLALRSSVQLAIKGVNTSGYAPVVTTLETTCIIPSATGGPDANDSLYQGDPNRRPPWVIWP